MTPSRTELLRLLAAYSSVEEDEQRYRLQMLEAASVAVDPFGRGEYTPGHFTASAFIIHPDGERVLLIHHGKIGIWVQPGGHVDPEDPGLIVAAMREVAEETGVADLTPISDGLFDIDIHEFPESGEQPWHLHFDLRFGFVAGSGVLAATEEVRDCRWVRLDELEDLGVGRSVTRPVSRLLRDLRLPPMIKRAIDAALLKREPYLVMVVRPDGVADGAIVVAVVHALLMIPLVLDGIGVLTAARVILYGLVNWIVLSGLVYLIGKHLLEGDGSYPGTMAATSIGYPVLLAAIVLAPFLDPLQAQLIVSMWLVATVWMAARAALDLPKAQAAAAAVGGWLAFVVVSLLFRF